MALVRSLSEDTAVMEGTKKNLMEIIGRGSEMSPAEASQAYKIVKLAKLFKKHFIVKAMLQNGAVQKFGKAPAGDLEMPVRKHIS